MLNGTNFKVWKDAVEIILGCVILDLRFRIEKPIPNLDNLQEDSIFESQSARKFLEEIKQFFAKNEKAETSNILAKLVSMKYKGRGNIREYIIEMSNLAAKFKLLKLELGEDLIVHLVLISLPAHFEQFKSFKAKVELQLGKKIKAIKSDHDGEYYGRYDRSGEQRFRRCGIVQQYTMPGKPSMNDVFEKEENIRNIDFEKESINDIDTTQTIVPDIVPDIVPKQDYDKVLPQTPIEQPQQPQEVTLRRFIRERRHTISYDYIVFLQEHEDNISLTKDDSINFCQDMQSSNSQKWIDVMKDEMKFGMKDSKPRDTLIAKRDKVSIKQCPNNDLERNEMQNILYASIMGNLMYALNKVDVDVYILN
ncbi:hypothetical protein CR513_20292, partial [Mucuna pruriens]